MFSTLNQWTTEELFFPEHDFGGSLWENRAGYEKWDPAKHTDQWATPMLVRVIYRESFLGEKTNARTKVIHNELDYRLPISEGLAMFNVLQARGVPSKLVMFPDENHVSSFTRYQCVCLFVANASLVGAQAGKLSRLAQRGLGVD